MKGHEKVTKTNYRDSTRNRISKNISLFCGGKSRVAIFATTRRQDLVAGIKRKRSDAETARVRTSKFSKTSSGHFRSLELDAFSRFVARAPFSPLSFCLANTCLREFKATAVCCRVSFSDDKQKLN